MQIPLYGWEPGSSWAKPGPVVAYAEVDPEDFEELSQHRWALNPDGYGVRTSHRPAHAVCPECGWLPRPGVRPARSVAAHRAKMHGVSASTLPKRRTIMMHRQILGLKPGDPRTGDHKNRNRLDNQRSNLRIISHAAQMQNQGKAKLYGGKPTESSYLGVYKVKKKGKWTGRWKAIAGNQYLGCFVSEEDAAKAAADYRLKTMPYALD